MKAIFKKILSVLLAITLSVFAFLINPSDISAAQYTLTDYSTDIPYSIVISNNNITIRSAYFNEDIYIDSPVIACSVCNGLFSFLSYIGYDGDYVASCYTYDIDSAKLTSIATLLPVFTDETRFAVDSQNRFYLVDRSDNCIVNCFYEGRIISSIKLSSTIYQLISFDGIHITALTTEGVYLISNSTATLISDARPVVPCTYLGDGLASDSLGTIFTYENGGIYSIVTETTTPPTNPVNSEQTQKPNVKDNYIFTEQGVTIAKLRKSFGVTKEEFTVYKPDGSIYTQGKLGTGMTVSVLGKKYSIIILGELTGEGNINSRDLKLMMKFLTGEETPSNIQNISADINCDGKICTKDLLKLSKLY